MRRSASYTSLGDVGAFWPRRILSLLSTYNPSVMDPQARSRVLGMIVLPDGVDGSPALTFQYLED